MSLDQDYAIGIRCDGCQQIQGEFYQHPGRKWYCLLCHEKIRRGEPVWPVISENLAVQVRYERMRDAGQTHKFAEMCALQKPFGLQGTDSSFFDSALAGQEDGDRFIRQYRQQAEAAGIDTAGAVYLGGLARYPGDPRAWVRSRGEIKRLCEEQNLECHGAVRHTARDVEPSPAVDLDPALLDAELRRVEKSLPEPLTGQERGDLREAIYDDLKPSWATASCPHPEGEG